MPEIAHPTMTAIKANAGAYYLVGMLDLVSHRRGAKIVRPRYVLAMIRELDAVRPGWRE